LEIPRSTALSWIRRGPREVVSLDSGDDGEPALRNRVAKLERRIAMLTAVLRLVLGLMRVSGFKLELSRVPDAVGKRRLLSAIDHARRSIPLSAALRVLRPNEAWHIDVTIIRLLDGTRAYVHAVIDNFSRRILAWTVAASIQ
jgi:transposase InsO family protein